MNDNYGLDYRSMALFCTGKLEVARGYAAVPGFVVIEILPLGDFSLCFSSKCYDLYAHFQFKGKLSDEQIRNSIVDLNFVEYKNGGLLEARQSGCEVMLFAQRFEYRRIA
jgi:hypothetical protein